MSRKAQSIFVLLFIVTISFSLAGCHKKKPPRIEPEGGQPPGITENQPGGEMPPEQPKEQVLKEGEITDERIVEITRLLQPVFYDYNRADIREDQIPALQNNARVLKQYAAANVLIEGHCDERGTDEYNLALGERRAKAAKDYLVSLGIDDGRINTISYGESKPFAEGHNENAWQQNRRAHFVAVKK
jgi:peptidoglycan-associated lipoprotein